MELRNICCSTVSVETIQLGRPMHLDRPLKVTRSSNSRSTAWRSLWKKLMREKRKIRIFDCSTVHASQVHLPGYDPRTYAQNFDQGLMWDDEPDSLARSFSMRFAAPTRLINASADNSKSNNNNASLVMKTSVTNVGHDLHHDVVICVF